MVWTSKLSKKHSGGGASPTLFLSVLALVISLINLNGFLSLPISKAPIPSSDVALYWYLAKKMQVDGIFLSSLKGVFFSPIYAFLFFVFSKLGNNVTVASVFSSVCFILSGYFFFKLNEQIFNNYKIAFIASLLFILYRPLEFYAVLPIKTFLFILLFIIFLFCILRTPRINNNVCYVLIGILFVLNFGLEGLSLPLSLLMIFYSAVKHKWGKKGFALFLIGLFIGVIPFSVRDFTIEGSIFPFSRISGIHFYIGNNLKSNGFYHAIRGIRANAFGHYYDAKFMADRLNKKKLNDSEVNLFWIKKTINSFIEYPHKHLLLLLRKLFLSVNNFEYPNNFDIYVIERKMPLLKINPFDFSFVFAFGLAGLILYFLIEKSINELFIGVVFFPLLLSLFFIASRYRIIWVIFLIPFAAYFVFHLREVFSFRYSFVVILVAIAFTISRISTLPKYKIKIINADFCSRIERTAMLHKLEEKFKVSKNKKRILLLEAKVFYNVGMWEIGDFLRERAYRIH